ncbi:MAG: cyclic pyranopterin monophosphate synthase MoaC [Acidithiobacillus sp.]|nr:cyclic pyranopterin monophosphate synthase MoaC [Acidithiobacillus sp.]
MKEDHLTHFNAAGEAHMVDVAAKSTSARLAIATGEIHMQAATLQLIRDGALRKGDVLGVARIAAIQASKRTAELIPLAHPLFLTGVEVHFSFHENPSRICCEAEVRCQGQTGVEMEALTAVSVGLLTIYDMCKAVDRGMILSKIGITRKEGGKSGRWERS